MKENRIFSQINFLPDQMFLAFMSWIWMNIPMNDISWKWKGELLLLTTNSLIPCDRHTELWRMQPCSQSRSVRCVQQVAEGEGWVEESVIPGSGPRGLSEVVTSIIGVAQRLWPVSLSLPQLSVTADTLLSQSHTQRSVSVGPTLPSDRCQWSNQCFVSPHNISLLRQLQTNVLLCFAWPTDDVVIPTYEGRSNGNIMKVTWR